MMSAAWTSRLGARAAAFAALLLALWALVATEQATLLAWTERVFPISRYPALFAALFATWLGVASARTPSARRLALLGGSLVTGAIFDVWFVLATVVWLVPFHAILFSRAERRVRWATLFTLSSTALLAVACNRSLWSVEIEWPEVARGGYLAATSLTFRLAWLLREVHVQRTKSLPFLDVVSYFVFAPFFVIVPYMLAIPRCDRFREGLAKHDVAVEKSGLRMIFVGAALSLGLALGSRIYDPQVAGATAVRTHHYVVAILHGLMYYPPKVIVQAVAISSILIGMVRVLGFDLAPSFVRPELSKSITEWWRRWNVHFRDLLVELFFYPIMLKYRRQPRKATVLGCATVFLVGNFVFHWPKTYFSAGTFRAVPMGTLTEGLLMFGLVTYALLREQARRGAVVVARPLRGMLTTWALVFGVVVLVGYTVTAVWQTDVMHIEIKQLQPGSAS